MTVVEGYDLVMIGILLAAAVLGYFKGIVWQLAWIIGIAASSFVAVRFGPVAAPFFGEQAPWNRLLAMLALYAASSLGVWLVFRVISGAINAIHLSAFDHQLGLVFGAAKGLLLCVIVTFFAVTLAPAYREQIVASQSGRILAEVLASAESYIPADLHDTVEPYLKRFEEQFNAAPAGPLRRDSVGPQSAAESPLMTVWQGVQSAAAWAGVEQGGQGARQAGGPLPDGTSWFSSPSSSNQPAAIQPSGPPGGYPIGAQSRIPGR